MNKIIILPLEGMIINNKSIKFGYTKSQVELILGNSSDSDGKVLYFYNNALQISLDNDGFVNYIQIFYHIGIPTFIYNINIFNTKVSIILPEIEKKYKFDRDNWEVGYTYIFPDIEICLGRISIPGDDENGLIETDYEKGIYFNGIGFGIKGSRSNQIINL